MEVFDKKGFEYNGSPSGGLYWDFSVDELQPEVFTKRVITEKVLYANSLLKSSFIERINLDDVTEDDVLACGI
jgi:hypothetical protein